MHACTYAYSHAALNNIITILSLFTDIEMRDEVRNTPVNVAARLGHDR